LNNDSIGQPASLPPCVKNERYLRGPKPGAEPTPNTRPKDLVFWYSNLISGVNGQEGKIICRLRSNGSETPESWTLWVLQESQRRYDDGA
jgi:hypothetical protein